MKDKILEAVQISKTYGEGESAVHALRNSDLTLSLIHISEPTRP